jgi:hypothetical protein
MPAAVVSSPNAQPVYVPENSNKDIAFFRVSSHSLKQKIYPGDSRIVLSIPYYMDNEIYCGLKDRWRLGVSLFKRAVKATLYLYGFRPLTVGFPDFLIVSSFDPPNTTTHRGTQSGRLF